MQKNVSGQKIGCQMVSATDGSAFTSAVTVYVTGDAGTQAAGSVGSGACTHEGNGYHTYAPAQAETNYDLIAFTFIGTGAVPATVQVFTGYPQTGDAYARLGAPAGASVSADVAAVKAQTAAIETDTQHLQTQIGTDGAGLTAIGDTRLANLDATVSSRLATAGYTAPLDAAGTRTAVGLATANLDTQLSGLPTDADVQAAAAAALTAYDPPTNAEMEARTLVAASYATAAALDAIDNYVDTEIAAIKAKTDNLPASPAAVGSAMTLTAAYDAAKTAASQASVDDLPTVAEFEARTLPAADYTVVSDLPSVPSAASIADAVWDEAIAGHAGAGSTGAALAAAGAAGDPWATALPGAYGAGTAGKLLSDIEAVAPDNKPTVAATGEASANVTHHAGVAVAAADANGNVPTVLYPTQGAVTFGQVKILADINYEGALHIDNNALNGVGLFAHGTLIGQHNHGQVGQRNDGDIYGQYNHGEDAGQYNEGDIPVIGAASQGIANALKLAPAAGTPAAGSVYDLLGDASIVSIDPQAVRDAMLLAPTPHGTAAAGSVDAKLDGLASSVAAELSNSSDCTASGAISRTRGNTWIINATVGAITGYTSLWLTIKHSRGGPDSDAILQVKLNASGVGDGLLYVNGTPASDSAKAAITVNNAATGTITITVDEVITAALPVGEFAYDIQTLVSGVVATPDSGTFTVTADVTRSVT